MVQFDLHVRLVEKASFVRKVQETDYNTHEVDYKPFLNRVSEHTMRQCVRAGQEIDLRQLWKLILDSRRWAYSIGFDIATIEEDCIWDIRLRHCLEIMAVNVHPQAIPMCQSHTKELMVKVTINVPIPSLGWNWNKKM